MGYTTALEISTSKMPIEAQLNLHLQYNFYPPVPSSMVQPCVDAIDAYWAEDIHREIELPQGVEYRGKKTAPAHAIVDNHRLDPWLVVEED
jgi:hypothetical protein